MHCSLLSKDLMFASQVAGAARVAAFEIRTFATSEALLAAAAEHGGTLTVLVDLGMAGLDLASLTAVANQLREQAADATLIAIGAHVHADKLAAAKQAGFDFVLTKGQASRELSELFARLAAA